MAEFARFFKGYFRNLDGTFEYTLPANSEDHFYNMYSFSDYRIDRVEHLGFYKVEIYGTPTEITFSVPALPIYDFKPESWGYGFLHDHFAKQIREIERQIEIENRRNYGYDW